MNPIANETSCPDQTTLRSLLDGTLAEAEQAAAQSHVDACPKCEAALRQMTTGGESWIGVAARLKEPAARVGGESPMAAAMDRLKNEDELAGESPEPTDPQRTLDFLSPSDDPKSLGRLGQHEVLEVVGWGGMGVVLKAYDPSLHRVVAVKVLASHLAHHAVARKRFIREAQAAAAVCHDNVVTIHAIEDGSLTRSVSEGDRSPNFQFDKSASRGASAVAHASGYLPKIVMQFVAGGSLQERIDQDGPLELKEVLRIAMQTAAGLAAAHAQGVVHRDVKPANILLENGVERVKLTDFGLARVMDDASLTLSGVIAGTPQYMAPEQAWGRDVDARADLFSLGAVMYAMCSGHSPFRARTTMAVLKRVCEDSPRPLRAINPDIPDWLVAIIEKLLAKNPDDRFQTATEVSDLLGRWLAHVQQPNVVAAPARTVTRPGRAGRMRDVTSPVAAEVDSRLLMAELQKRPEELRHRLRWAGLWLIVLALIGIPAFLFLMSSIQVPNAAAWSPAESFRFSVGIAALIAGSLFLLTMLSRWLLVQDSPSVRLSDAPESHTTDFRWEIGFKYTFWPVLVIGALMMIVMMLIIRDREPLTNIQSFVGFAAMNLAASYAVGSAFRAAWNSVNWLVWIGVVLLLLAVGQGFLFLGATYQAASPIVQVTFIVQGVMALAALFGLLFVRPLLVRDSERWMRERLTGGQRLFAIACFTIAGIPLTLAVMYLMSESAGPRSPRPIAPPTAEKYLELTPLLPDLPAESDRPLGSTAFPKPRLLTESGAASGGQSVGDPFDESITSAGPPRTKPATGSVTAELKLLQGRWVVLTLQGTEPPIVIQNAAGGGFGGGGPPTASVPAAGVPSTPMQPDQLQYLNFQGDKLTLTTTEQSRFDVSVKNDRELLLVQPELGPSPIRHGVFTIADDRLVICWASANSPLPRGFQPNANEQLVVCRREWTSPRQANADPDENKPLIDERTKLPKAEMPFSPHEASELQAAWAEKLKLPMETTNSIGMVLRVIPPGSFGDSREPPAAVSGFGSGFAGGGGISGGVATPSGNAMNGPILVGVHEVTIGQFRQFVEDSKYVTENEHGAIESPTQAEVWRSWRNPEFHQDSDRHPVVNVSPIDAWAFCHWLSLKEQRPYRLLTQREWEFCVRAGTWLPVTLGPGKLAHRAQFFRTTAPVGSYPANPFGLHDFIGNAAEWCLNMEAPNVDSPPRLSDILCGSDFSESIQLLPPKDWTGRKFPTFGFRIAVDLTPSTVITDRIKNHSLSIRAIPVRLQHPQDATSDGKRIERTDCVWIEMPLPFDLLPYAVEWLDFELVRGESELNISPTGGHRFVGNKPVKIDDALQLLERTDWEIDDVPLEFKDPVLTMPIPKVTAGDKAWKAARFRSLTPEEKPTAPAFLSPRLFRFLDFSPPQGIHSYQVRFKYRIHGLQPSTEFITPSIVSSAFKGQTSTVTIDSATKDLEPGDDSVPLIELKPPAAPANPKPDSPTPTKGFRFKRQP